MLWQYVPSRAGTSWFMDCQLPCHSQRGPQSPEHILSSAPSFEKQDRTQIPRACSSCTPSSVCNQEPSSGPWNNAARTAVGQHGDFLKSTAFIQTIQLFTVLINSSRPEMYTAQGHKLPLTRWQSETKLNQKKRKEKEKQIWGFYYYPSSIYDLLWQDMIQACRSKQISLGPDLMFNFNIMIKKKIHC